MNNSHYTIRNYQPKDFDKYVRLIIEAEILEPTGRCTSARIIAEHLGRPNYSYGQDLFIAEIDEVIVGYIDVTPELTIKRVILDCWVHPVHRKRGLATKLLGYATNRAKEIGAEAAHVSLMGDNVVVQKMLSRLGFNLVRRFLELRLNISDVQWPESKQIALECNHLQRGEEDKLTQIQNRAFVGTWGYNPNTTEEIIYHTNSSTCSPEDIILIYKGDKVLGYCWTGVTYEGGATSKRIGRICMLGIDPDYRNKGIGKTALLAGLALLKGKELQIAELTVDSDNKAARALYKSIGFKIHKSSFWYERVIN